MRNKVGSGGIYLLPVRATDIYTLPTLDLNEAQIGMDELGVPLDWTTDREGCVDEGRLANNQFELFSEKECSQLGRDV